MEKENLFEVTKLSHIYRRLNYGAKDLKGQALFNQLDIRFVGG